MPTRKIEFGTPVQTLDSTQLREGQIANYINGYIDMDGSFRLRPGLTLWKDFSDAGKPVTGLYYNNAASAATFWVVYNGATNGLLRKVASDGTPTTVTGTTLS